MVKSKRFILSILGLPLNVFSTYYFQAVLKPKAAFIVSVSRGLVVSGIFIFLLPALFGADSIWFSMPLTNYDLCVNTAQTTIKEIVKMHLTN